MTSAAVSLGAGVVFGVALAAPPGPMNAIIAEESVRRGWDAGFRAGVGAMLADVVFLVLAIVGVAAVVSENPTVEALLYVVGGLLMLAFAVDAVAAVRGASFTDAVADASTGFRKAFVLAITNPYQIGFWLTVGVGLLSPGVVDVLADVPLVGNDLAGRLVVETGSPALLAGLFGGILVWIVAYPAAMAAAGRRVDAFAPVVALGSGVVLAGFGALFLAMGVGTFV